MKEYKLKEEYIELVKLLKLLRIAETGGHAKLMIEDGLVYRNGEQEFRKRAKLRDGDVIEVSGIKVSIIGMDS
jgi:ribosome-associated protein